tara:strand:+ start:703 stop:1140 length:438 start_codon:yes stop_codon:yes gene_type:complete
MRKDLDKQIQDHDKLHKTMNVALPLHKVENLDAGVNLLERQKATIEKQQEVIDSLRKKNDELRVQLDELDSKVLAVDRDAKRAIAAVARVQTQTPARGDVGIGGASIDDEKSVISNPGVVYSNAEKEEMREHLRRILIGAAPAPK